MTEDDRPVLALASALRKACAALRIESPGQFSIVEIHADSCRIGYGRYTGTGLPAQGAIPLTTLTGTAETIIEARELVKAAFPASWPDRLMMGNESAGFLKRRWFVIDIDTLGPRVIKGRLISVEYSTAALAAPATASA